MNRRITTVVALLISLTGSYFAISLAPRTARSGDEDSPQFTSDEADQVLVSLGYLYNKKTRKLFQEVQTLQTEGHETPPALQKQIDDLRHQFGERRATDVSQAISAFQAAYGLKATGELDAETKKLMKTDRCGVPDVLASTDEPIRWKKKKLTFCLAEESTDLQRAVQIALVRDCLKTWGDEAGLTCTEEQNPKTADIVIAFKDLKHQDIDFDSVGHTLAHAFFPDSVANPGLAGQVHISKALTWIQLPGYPIPAPGLAGTTRDLNRTMLHELGHALGLAHNPKEAGASIMYPYYPGQRSDLSADDKAAIKELYK